MKLVLLVGFIIKKFVTMHGHMNVKSLSNYLEGLCVQGVSRFVDITAGGYFLGLCDQKSSYKLVSDFGRLRNYDRLKFRIKGNDY